MRPIDSNYNDFEDFDYGGVETVRRMIKRRQRDDLKHAVQRRAGLADKERWVNDDWGKYDCDGDPDYRDYDADEFDRYSGISTGDH